MRKTHPNTHRAFRNVKLYLPSVVGVTHDSSQQSESSRATASTTSEAARYSHGEAVRASRREGCRGQKRQPRESGRQDERIWRHGRKGEVHGSFTQHSDVARARSSVWLG